MTRTRTPELRQWPYGDQLITTMHIDRDGEESIEITGVYEKLELELDVDRGHELVLIERARPDHR